MVNVRCHAFTLAEAIATYTYPLDTNQTWSSVNPGPVALDAERRAEEAARLIDAAATAYVKAVDDFEATAKVKIA
jgi:hypothetical protein